MDRWLPIEQGGHNRPEYALVLPRTDWMAVRPVTHTCLCHTYGFSEHVGVVVLQNLCELNVLPESFEPLSTCSHVNACVACRGLPHRNGTGGRTRPVWLYRHYLVLTLLDYQVKTFYEEYHEGILKLCAIIDTQDRKSVV